jgi:hypothetical protein
MPSFSVESEKPREQSGNARQAEFLAELGLLIFPARADKKPFVRDWENAASSDINKVRAWWSTYPDALIGLPCKPNGICVLDLDHHDGAANGYESFAELKKQGTFPKGMIVVRTPSGGAHFYFSMPFGGLKTTASTLAPGIDTRGSGGYVIGVGSVLPNGACWELRHPASYNELVVTRALKRLPPFPTWLIPKLEVRSARQFGHAANSNWRLADNVIPLEASRAEEAEQVEPTALAALEEHCQMVRSAVEGTRNDTLNRASFKIGLEVASGTLPQKLAERRLTEAALAVGLPEDETQKTIASGISAGSRTVTQAGNLLVTRPGNLLTKPHWPQTYQSGKPKPGYQNAKVAVQALGIVCKHDTFHGRKTIGRHPIARFGGEITDDAVAALRDVVVQAFGFDPGKDHLFDAVNALCLENGFDPVCEWLDSLKWDGQARLGSWLITYAGAEDAELNRAAGVLMLIAMVRRAKSSGCKYDVMVVLEGRQGSGKSSLLAALAGPADNFTDAPLLNCDVKAVAEALRGRWVAEIPELAGLRRSDVEDVKALISRTDDRARPAYGRTVESQPRRCVFVGTTNSSEYLSDDTGNRRFVPVRVGSVDLEAFRRDRDQLFAEAVQLEGSYGQLTLPPRLWEVAASQAEKRRIADPWMETLRERLAAAHLEVQPSGEARVATTALEAFLGLEAKHCNSGTSRRITSAMRDLGWQPLRYRPTKGGEKIRGFGRMVGASP